METETESVCPWYIGVLLANPLRKLIQNPDKIIGEYVKPGMKVIDYGSAMGYFSLPMAKKVGNNGRVYCFDIQEKMLGGLVNRAKSAGLVNIIEPRLIMNDDHDFDDLKQTADFALLFAVAHEVPDQKRLFNSLAFMLKSGAKLLFAEPKGHVKPEAFAKSVSLAEKAGFKKAESSRSALGLEILLEKI